MTDVEIQVLDDPASAAAELLAHAVRRGGEVALCGGSTIGATFDKVVGLAPDWSTAGVWWGDDRAVPPDDERSNYRLAKERLFVRLQSQPRAVNRIEGELGPEEAADRYETAFAGVALDLALNGIGADGHTASLFPDAPGLGERVRRVVAADAGLEPFVARVTMTPPAFAEAALLVYLVTGEGKAEAVRRAVAADPSPETPASLVRGRRTVALLDGPAAARL